MSTVNDVRDLRTIWGMWVRCLIEFPDRIPVGSIGIIDEIYDENDGVVVAWNFKDSPVPTRYPFLQNSIRTKIRLVRDGFGRNNDELVYLELLGASSIKQSRTLGRFGNKAILIL